MRRSKWIDYNCRKFKIVSFPPQSKQIHDPRLGKEGLEGGGGKVLSEVVSKGLWQNYCMQPLSYFKLKIWFFFSASIRHLLQAYTQFHRPNNDTVNHAAQVANT